MHTLKEKVSNQLSRLFADSPYSTPSSPHDSNSQARSSSEGETRPFSSFFSHIVTSLGSTGSKSYKHEHDIRATQLLPAGWWSTKDFDQLDECSGRYHQCDSMCDEEFMKSSEDIKQHGTVCEGNQTVGTPQSSEDASSAMSSDGDVFGETSNQQTPGKPLSDLMDESTFISQDLFEFFQSFLPNIVKGCKWVLLYSTLKHGISLRTLIRKSAELSGPCLLIVGDKQGAVLGGLLECPLRPTAKRKYQGTNQTFVFTTIYGEPRLFRPTGANRYYYMCLNDLLALGGGGNFALRLDGDLLNGTSGPCETFGNLCLAHNSEFELKNVEADSRILSYLKKEKLLTSRSREQRGDKEAFLC